MIAIDQAADELGVSGRTLRRAAGRGLVRAHRDTAALRISLSERRYLKEYWPLLAGIVAALRTEPSVRFAAVFGSVARGEGAPNSDVDLLVTLKDEGGSTLADLEARLEGRIARPVHLVRLDSAKHEPLLLARALEEARTLIDREGVWPELERSRARLRRSARQLKDQQRARAAEQLGLA